MVTLAVASGRVAGKGKKVGHEKVFDACIGNYNDRRGFGLFV